MKSKEKRTDSIQNTIIALLCVITVLLFCKTAASGMLSNRIGNVFSSDASSNTISSAGDFKGNIGSEPMYIVVTSDGGTHYSSKYSDERDELVTKFSAMLGEALGSAKNPKSISEDEWRDALKNESVLFDYVFPQSLGFLSLTLGTNSSASISGVVARRMLLSIDGSSLYLCFADESSGSFYRCETAPSAVSLAAKIAECPIGDAQFSFEYGDQYANLDPYFIFANENIAVSDISSDDPTSSFPITSTLLNIFGVNENTSSHYTESNGSEVYVDSSRSLRIDSDGRIVFSAVDKTGIPIKYSGSSPTLTEVLTACGDIVGSVFSYYGIDASLGVTDITGGSEPASSTISFGQFINGIPVSVSGSPGIAVFRINNGSITRIDLLLRSYSVSSLDSTSPLPEKQTAAIISENGGEPVLMYTDDGSINPSVSWILIS